MDETEKKNSTAQKKESKPNEAEIIELLFKFESENNTIPEYPRWRSGFWWALSAALFTALILYVMYFVFENENSSFTLLNLFRGAFIIGGIVFTGVAFLPSRN